PVPIDLVQALLDLLLRQALPAQELATGDDAEPLLGLPPSELLLPVDRQDRLEDHPVGELLQGRRAPTNRPERQAVRPLQGVAVLASHLVDLGEEVCELEAHGVP